MLLSIIISAIGLSYYDVMSQVCNGNATSMGIFGCSSSAYCEVEYVKNQVYGCAGEWNVTGLEDAGAEICKGPGWTICEDSSYAEMRGLTSDDCKMLGDENKFYATLATASSDNPYACNESETSTGDNIFGCTNELSSLFWTTLDATDSSDNITCGVLDAFISTLTPYSYENTSWDLSRGSNESESTDVEKTDSNNGGILCCKVAIPTAFPTSQSNEPSVVPSLSPSQSPSTDPSSSPSTSPSTSPSGNPSGSPSSSPSGSPSGSPTMNPSDGPSMSPSDGPSGSPSNSPSGSPSQPPTMSPSDSPVLSPTEPSVEPTRTPSAPTDTPTRLPTPPTVNPTYEPTRNPTQSPTKLPTINIITGDVLTIDIETDVLVIDCDTVKSNKDYMETSCQSAIGETSDLATCTYVSCEDTTFTVSRRRLLQLDGVIIIFLVATDDADAYNRILQTLNSGVFDSDFNNAMSIGFTDASLYDSGFTENGQVSENSLTSNNEKTPIEKLWSPFLGLGLCMILVASVWCICLKSQIDTSQQDEARMRSLQEDRKQYEDEFGPLDDAAFETETNVNKQIELQDVNVQNEEQKESYTENVSTTNAKPVNTNDNVTSNNSNIGEPKNETNTTSNETETEIDNKPLLNKQETVEDKPKEVETIDNETTSNDSSNNNKSNVVSSDNNNTESNPRNELDKNENFSNSVVAEVRSVPNKRKSESRESFSLDLNTIKDPGKKKRATQEYLGKLWDEEANQVDKLAGINETENGSSESSDSDYNL